MNFNIYTVGLAASALLMLSSCIDDKYDLSDIDTTTELKVNDLTVPVNLKSITLDEVIEVDENDPNATIKYVTIGNERYYAIEKHGSFHAEPTSIKRVTAPRPDGIDPIEQDLEGQPVAVSQSRRRAPGMAMRYDIKPDETHALYQVGKNGNEPVDEAIQTIEDVKMDIRGDELNIDLTLSSRQMASMAQSVVFENLRLTLPEGMAVKVVTTDASGKVIDHSIDGHILTIPRLEGHGNEAKLSLVSNDIDFRKDKTVDPDGKGIKVVDGAFDYTAVVGVIDGTMTVYPKENQTLPSNIRFTIDYDLSGFTVTKFSGDISYSSDIAEVEPVDLGDLPDFLAGDETDIIMQNPQIVLTVNNPAGQYGLSCDAGLSITAIRDNMTPTTQELPRFAVGNDKGHGPYTIVLAPHPSEAINIDNAPNRSDFPFSGLSHVLSGSGIPDRLDIELKSRQWPEPRVHGEAKNFPLGEDLEDVDGNYTFMTLLALADGSRIVYEKIEDGWSDDDVDAINVSLFTVTAEALTDLPCGVKLWVRPIDKNGKDIEIDNPEEAVAEIGPMAQNTPFTISMRGDIRHIDGIHIIATAESFDGKPMLPGQTIKLNNLRAKVTGTYIKKL